MQYVFNSYTGRVQSHSSRTNPGMLSQDETRGGMELYGNWTESFQNNWLLLIQQQPCLQMVKSLQKEYHYHYSLESHF